MLEQGQFRALEKLEAVKGDCDQGQDMVCSSVQHVEPVSVEGGDF